MEIYRTFVGVPLKVGEDFLQARLMFQKALDGERISWVDPSLFHITLRFLGDTPVGRVGDIAAALREHVERPRISLLRFGRTGSFSSRGNPRVIWVGFEDERLFAALRMGVDRALEACGIPNEQQGFRAHLTLGRVRSMGDPGNLYRTLETMEGDFRSEVSVDRLIFYRSILGKGRAIYQPLEELEFPA
jgi:2'-5' RNA ligase